ncbi:hypothetical protein C9374_001159 [Naegleria lovaniensis]|uniref:Major facilitator superfamily (MFS) profile domain-containing protein n=1 Tax=Naegleria lovaniensis TaxID=51637 RepID=A0AA88KL78_NAELO|nr:uncharacterized protein C9374_001159 [Naegleria lovaniensis]KAG2387565.1 hypothetical protein C9374_001159 [Naegleria lovaniensis]
MMRESDLDIGSGRASVDEGSTENRSSIDITLNEQERGHTIDNYAQLDAASSKPVLKRNPYISLLFHNKRFLIIWMAGVLSGMGNYFSEIAVVYEIEHRTNIGFATGALFLSIFAPSCLAMPFAGLCSDIFDRRKVLIIANIVRAVIAFCFLFALLIKDNNPLLFGFYYVCMALMFFTNAFYDASRGCLMPLVVDHHDLVACNALDSLTWLFCSYTGAAIGGLITSMASNMWTPDSPLTKTEVGLVTTFVLNGVLFILALILTIVLMRYPELNPPKPADFPKGGIALAKHSIKELYEGFKLLLGGKGYLLSFTVMKLLGSFIWASVEFINVKLSEFPTLTLMDSPENTMTIAYSLFGIGSGLAPMVCELLLGNRIRRSVRSAFWTRFVILVSFFMLAVGFGIMTFTIHASMFIAANFILGAAGGTMWVYSMASIEHLTPNHFLGRITAFDICFGFGAGQALGVLVPSPFLNDIFGIKQPHLFALVMFCLAWVLFIFWVIWFYLTKNIHQHHVEHDEHKH